MNLTLANRLQHEILLERSQIHRKGTKSFLAMIIFALVHNVRKILKKVKHNPDPNV